MKKQKITLQYEQEKHTENISELQSQVESYQSEVASLKYEISNLRGQLASSNSASGGDTEQLGPVVPCPWLYSSIKGYITEQKTITATAAVNEQWRYYQYLLNYMYEERVEVLLYEKSMMVKNAAGGGDVKGTQREWDKAVKVLNKALSFEGLSPSKIYMNESNQMITQQRLIVMVSDSLRSKINQVYFCKPCYESLKTAINCLHVIAQGCVSHFKNTNNKVIKKIHNDHGLTLDIILEPSFDYRSWVYQLNLPSVIEFTCYCNVERGEWSIVPIERNTNYADFDVRKQWLEAPQKSLGATLESRGEKRSRGRPPLNQSQKGAKNASLLLSPSSPSSMRNSSQIVIDSDSDDDNADDNMLCASTSSSNARWKALGTVAAMVTGSLKRDLSDV